MKQILLYTTLLLAAATTQAATCTGSRSCNACRNCNSCKHCNEGGGRCGVCSSHKIDDMKENLALGGIAGGVVLLGLFRNRKK